MVPNASHRPSLTVAALELPARFGDPEGQLARAEALLQANPAIDLAVLPEASLTGYLSALGDADLRPFAESLDGPTVRAFGALARKYTTAIAGPLVERERGRFYNSLVLLDATGTLVGRWRKRHPWIPERWATPGDLGTPVVTLAGLRITAAICYDLHFIRRDAPEALNTADLLLFPSAWVDDRGAVDHRTTMLSSLAADHGLWVVNANWGVGIPVLRGQGGSMAVDPTGAVVARAHLGNTPPAVTARVQARGGA